MGFKAFLFCCAIAFTRADFQGQHQFQSGGLNNGFNNGGFNNGGFNNGGFDNGFNNGGFGGGVPISSQSSQFGNRQVQKQNQAQGNSAAAGNAAAQGLGTASSINQAQHQANRFNTASNSLSANTASGTLGSQAGGAAQAGGQISNQKQIASQFGNQNSEFVGGGGFRRKRQAYGSYFQFPQSQANANSLGGGSALYGQVGTNNNAFSQTSPFAGTGFAAGNSYGQGQGVSIYQAANTNSASGYGGRRRRQIGFGGYGFPQSNANANALGGGSAYYGRVGTNNIAYSRTNPFGANGFSDGNAFGAGLGVNIYDAANTNVASGIFG